MNLTNKQSLIAIAVLAVVCLFMGAKLYVNNSSYDKLFGEYGELELDKEQVMFDLEKMRFSYDTLETENSMMVAEIAAQRDKIDGLLTKVKNGNWSLAKAKKEAQTLRVIMKGYIATIDSVNQLNIALTEENVAMKERVEEVQDRNANLERRQENMEEIIAAGQILQCSDMSALGVRILSSGRQRETSRADRTDMIKVCFTLLENPIAEPGDKELFLRIVASDGTVLASADADGFSATRNIDYANDRLEACIFYSTDEESGGLASGIYTIEVLEEDVIIGSTELELR
jgi:FtsZ-binding cell division protein ZapB